MKRVKGLHELYSRQHGLCYYCRSPMVMGSPGPSGATRDHVRPKCRGGRNAGNLVAACRHCNECKGSMSKRQFMAALPEVVEERQTIQEIRRAAKKSRKNALEARLAAIMGTANAMP